MPTNREEWQKLREERKKAKEESPAPVGRDARAGEAFAQYTPKKPLHHVTFTHWRDGTVELYNEQLGEAVELLHDHKWTCFHDFKALCDALIDYARTAK